MCRTLLLPQSPEQSWKRLEGKNPQGKNFRKLLRSKQSSAKISKISRHTLKSSESDMLLSSEKSSETSSANIFLRSLPKFLPFAFVPSGSFRQSFRWRREAGLLNEDLLQERNLQTRVGGGADRSGTRTSHQASLVGIGPGHMGSYATGVGRI